MDQSADGFLSRNFDFNRRASVQRSPVAWINRPHSRIRFENETVRRAEPVDRNEPPPQFQRTVNIRPIAFKIAAERFRKIEMVLRLEKS